MKLTIERSKQILASRGMYVTGACDRCGRVLGWIRFTRGGEAGGWCSRECRDGVQAHDPGRCRYCNAKLPEGKRKGSIFCDDACRKASRRLSGIAQRVGTPKLSRTKPSIYAAFSSGKSTGRLRRSTP